MAIEDYDTFVAEVHDAVHARNSDELAALLGELSADYHEPHGDLTERTAQAIVEAAAARGRSQTLLSYANGVD